MNSSKRKNYFLKTSLHESIYVESGFSVISSPKCQLIAVHGMGAYSGWFDDLSWILHEEKIPLTSLDLPAFGRSGKRGEINSYKSWLESIKAVWKDLHSQNNGEKVFLLGHSLGAMVCLASLADLNPKPNGLIITAPGFMANPKSWNPFTFVIPTLLKALVNSPDKISPPFPPEVFESIQRGQHKIDFLTSEVKPKLLLEMVKVGQKAFTSFNSFNEIPFLMVLGEEDKFCENSVSEAFFNLVNSSQKTFKKFPNAQHDLFVLPEADEINQFIKDWLLLMTKD